jgi:hypothetical protein
MANEITSTHGTLVANTVATVTFRADFGDTVTVLNRGAGDIYLTLDGTAPTVGGANTSIVLANSTRTYKVASSQTALAVKLISSGTPAYTVESY